MAFPTLPASGKMTDQTLGAIRKLKEAIFMTTELEMLAWVAGLTVCMWLPYMLALVGHVGLVRALT